MKPVVIYVDDEPQNLMAFELNALDHWDLHLFSDPGEAIRSLSNIKAAVIISDQRMRGLLGNDVLAHARETQPNAYRIITTGYSDESVIIDSIKKAQVHDYFVKPWNVEDMVKKIDTYCSLYTIEQEKLKLRTELENNFAALKNAQSSLEHALREQEETNKELTCWVHPLVIESRRQKLTFPLQKKLILLVMDIVGSSSLHGRSINNFPAREIILGEFWKIIVELGGEVESQEGDKAYANFNFTEDSELALNSAELAVERFLSITHNLKTDCGRVVNVGLAVHIALSATISVREVSVNRHETIITRKKFDTSSLDIDLVHRIESCAHLIPGNNVIVTSEYLSMLKYSSGYCRLGSFIFKGQPGPKEIFIRTKNLLSEAELSLLSAKICRLVEDSPPLEKAS